MYEVMRAHALETVWCNPTQDNQILLAAQRITRPGGEIVSVPVMTRRITLPKNDRRYHVFQIGQVLPQILGLLPKNPAWTVESWVSFRDAVNFLPLFLDLYTDAGVHLPLQRSYYMHTEDRALIFAIDVTSKSPIDYEQDQIYLRLYTNAYYESDQATGLYVKTHTDGATIINMNAILQLQSQVASYRQKPGQVFCYVNGFYVDDINPFTAKPGDVAEYVYDASVKTVADLLVSSLQTFTSELDAVFKYLLHFQGTTDQIDYVDDIDVYCLYKTQAGYKGTMVHRNLARTLRMVTHRDYSLSVDVYEVIARKLAALLGDPTIDPRSLTVRLLIRKSGMIRPLTFENQRVFELYKLPDDDIQRAFLGVDSNMPYWAAPALENSAYTELMRVSHKEAQDITLIENCFGYNAISRVIGDTPSPASVAGNTKYFRVSPAMIRKATVYEYDADGTLLGWYGHSNSETYYAKHPETAWFEAIVGEGTAAPSVIEGEDNLILPANADYRVYMCYTVDGVPTRKWTDITGTSMYTVENGLLKWTGQEYDQWLQVRSNDKFLAYDISFVPVAGTVYFDLTEVVGGELRVMDLQMGDLDIWINGKSVIENLDCFVKFPRVYVNAKEYYVQPSGTTPQKLTVRFTGLANSSMQRRTPGDYGFVEYGYLSHNGRYNVRDDKVLRITVRGGLKDRSQLKFSEDHGAISINDATNGSPYQIRDIIVPLGVFTQSSTYALRAKSEVIDKAVEDYLSLKLPDSPQDSPSVIPKRYIVMSPFFAHLINDLANGDFDKTQLDVTLSDMDVNRLLAPYLPILEFDPLNAAYNIDYRYVLIHPTNLYTPIGLDLPSYRFVERVNKLYGRGLIQLSPHLTISLGGNS